MFALLSGHQRLAPPWGELETLRSEPPGRLSLSSVVDVAVLSNAATLQPSLGGFCGKVGLTPQPFRSLWRLLGLVRTSGGLDCEGWSHCSYGHRHTADNLIVISFLMSKWP